jgi:hypothetical protein
MNTYRAMGATEYLLISDSASGIFFFRKKSVESPQTKTGRLLARRSLLPSTVPYWPVGTLFVGAGVAGAGVAGAAGAGAEGAAPVAGAAGAGAELAPSDGTPLLAGGAVGAGPSWFKIPLPEPCWLCGMRSRISVGRDS